MSYYNGTAYTFTWDGRRLVGAVKGTKTMSFTYNDEGIRTSKTVNGVTHTYYLNGNLIMAEEWDDKLLVYLYDASGSPIGMMYRTESYASDAWDTFWFAKNLFGDIAAIYNESGTKVATYTYRDAWGNHSVSYSNGGGSTGAQYNPFRYRGYYYDTDLGMYYLQSRYYDATICRFISPDDTSVIAATPMALTDKNLYAYCDNNPVMRIDEDGEFWNILIGVGIGTLVGAVVSIISQLITEESPSVDSAEFWANVGVSALSGAVSGGLAASGVGLVGQVVCNALLGASSGLVETAISGESSVEKYVLRALEGATIGAIAGKIGGAGSASKHVSNSFWRMIASGTDNLTYYFSQINRQAIRDGLKATPSIIKATLPSITKLSLNIFFK